MKTWVERPDQADVVVASYAFEIEISMDGPYHIPPEEEDGDDFLVEENMIEGESGAWS